MTFPFECRSCNGREGSLILDLGVQPLANNLLLPEDLSKALSLIPAAACALAIHAGSCKLWIWCRRSIILENLYFSHSRI